MQPIFFFFFFGEREREREREKENLKCDHVLSLLFGGHLSLT